MQTGTLGVLYSRGTIIRVLVRVRYRLGVLGRRVKANDEIVIRG